MLTTPFLTDLDSRAAIKGSRDPLGVQSIWTRLGRHVVGNLTTVSSSVRDFTTLLLGYHFAERVANEHGGESDLSVFLKWEQLAAYARGHVNHDWGFRGVERVRKNLQDASSIALGIGSDAQILSNQKTYGLWGLYTVPARSSGLVEGDPTRLTTAGRELVERIYLPSFSKDGFKDGGPIVATLARSRSQLKLEARGRDLINSVAKILQPHILPAERPIYRDHLLLGGPDDRTNGSQAILAEAMKGTLDHDSWAPSPANVRWLALACERSGGQGSEVAGRLERIRTCELLLAPAAALFDHLLGRDGQTIADVAQEVRRQWGGSLPAIDSAATRLIEPELRDAENAPESGDRWLRIARALNGGRYEDALRGMIDHNRSVMGARSGVGPWVTEYQGTIQVRFRDDTVPSLPKRTELATYWRHPYFLNSLRAVAAQLEE